MTNTYKVWLLVVFIGAYNSNITPIDYDGRLNIKAKNL